MLLVGRLGNAETIPQQDSAERALNKGGWTVCRMHGCEGRCSHRKVETMAVQGGVGSFCRIQVRPASLDISPEASITAQ